jgi:hypothetical protein
MEMYQLSIQPGTVVVLKIRLQEVILLYTKSVITKPYHCDTATVTVNVAAPSIDAYKRYYHCKPMELLEMMTLEMY